MAAPFLPPGIKAKASRGRIPVSDEDRTAARAGMGGEKTAQAKQAAATPTSTEPVAPVAAEPTVPVAAELVATVADTAPTPEPTPVLPVVTAPAAAPAPVAAAPTPEPITEPTPAPTVATEPAAPTMTEAAAAPVVMATESAAPTKPAQPTATAAPARRGRKPTLVAPGSAPVALRSLKVPEGSWLEIKVVVAQLSAVEDVPHNIQTYIEAAHKHYEAYLRKQGKLPAK